MPSPRAGSAGFTNSGAGAAVATTLPTGTTAGDLCICVVGIRNTTAPGTWTETAGWSEDFTTQNSGDGSGQAVAVFSKTIVGGDGDPTFTHSDTGKFAWAMIAVQPDTPGNTLQINGTPTTAADTTAGTTMSAFPAATAAGGATNLLSVLLHIQSSTVNNAGAIDPTPPTNWTMPANGEASTNSGTTAATRQICAQVSSRSGQSGTVSPGSVTWTQGGAAVNGIAVMFHYLIEEVSSGLSATVNQAVETDSAGIIGRRKTAGVGQATETDTVGTTSARKVLDVGQVVETDTAGVVTASRTAAVAQATEVDSAGVITRSGNFQTVNQVIETDFANTVSVAHVVTANRVTETDTAGALAAVKAAAVGRAVEVDTAGAVGAISTAAVGRATETNSAGAAVAAHLTTVGQAVETNSAGTTEALRTLAVGATAETDSAEAVVAAKTQVVGQASEVNSTGAIAARSTQAVGTVVETDTAGTVGEVHVTAVAQVVETDSAGTIGSAKRTGVAQVIETDVSEPIGAGGSTPAGRATETDTAGTVTGAKTEALGQAAEVDSVGAVGTTRTVVVGQATETDSAGTATVRRTVVVGQVSETDQARPLGGRHTREVGQAAETNVAAAVVGSGGAQPPPAPEVDLMTLAFIVVTGVGQCVVDELALTEAGVPNRVCLAVPGEIAWDECDCGQFAQTITTDTPSRTFPNPEVNVSFDACGPPLLVMNVTASIARCVPGMDDNGHPPTCSALLDAARVMEVDREAVRRGITCCLREMRNAFRITHYSVGVSQSVGPQGGCAAINITYQFGVNYTCC